MERKPILPALALSLATMIGCESETRVIAEQPIPNGSAIRISETHTLGSGNTYTLDIVGPDGYTATITIPGSCPPLKINSQDKYVELRDIGGKGGSHCDLLYHDKP